MLGTRIIFMGMDGMPGGLTGEPQAEMLCAANHALPLFWLLGFDEPEVEFYAASSSGDDTVLVHPEGARYPFLIGYTADLIPRIQQRSSYLKPHLQDADAELLDRWSVFIAELEYPVVAIDTYELWCNMVDPDALHEEITDLLNCFNEMNHSTADSVLSKLKQDGRWSEGNSIALAGFGW